MMRKMSLALAIAVGASMPAAAVDFTFNQSPFAGTTALTTPDRQVVGNELFISGFNTSTDRLVFDTRVFDITAPLGFSNSFGANLPAGGAEVIVLRDIDADGNLQNGILNNAGLSANLIAGGVDTPGAGFFLYYNSVLDLNRLVYSTDLSSPLADLKIIARFTDVTGSAAQSGLANFSSVNFAGAVPEPASWAMLITGFGTVGTLMRRRRAMGVVRTA
jgi:hypothetical protein